MIVIRPITIQDLDSLEKLAHNACLGLTGLPRNRKALQKKIESSLESFAKQKLDAPVFEHYQFVLEDSKTGELGGTCAVSSKTGIGEPDYYFHIETLNMKSERLPVPKDIQLLHPISVNDGPSEIRSLYLEPDFRRSGLGRLLSLSRFLFMASFLQRFDKTTIAEMRGVVDKNNRCPFWEYVGRHFCDMEFHKFLLLLGEGKDFIPEILPQYPIYVDLLPKEAQQVIGKTHVNTQPALVMLSQEGFQFTDDVDLFDAGPKIISHTADIKTIRESQTATVKDISAEMTTDSFMISNTDSGFSLLLWSFAASRRKCCKPFL